METKLMNQYHLVTVLELTGYKFPYESVPDGAVLAPHHFYAVLFGLLFCAVVWDDYPHREPLITSLCLLTGFLSFLLIWPWYPVIGASVTLVSLVVAVIPLFTRDLWSKYPLKYRIAVALCIVIALDDAVEHAFPVGTPLDMFWKTYMLQHMM